MLKDAVQFGAVCDSPSTLLLFYSIQLPSIKFQFTTNNNIYTLTY